MEQKYYLIVFILLLMIMMGYWFYRGHCYKVCIMKKAELILDSVSLKIFKERLEDLMLYELKELCLLEGQIFNEKVSELLKNNG